MDQPLSPELLRRVDAYWRAANYLAVGQIYLYDNPLLREPLKPEHIKPRLLGHWGTTPGQNFIYVHLNQSAAGRRPPGRPRPCRPLAGTGSCRRPVFLSGHYCPEHLGYEHGQDDPVIRLWNDCRHGSD